LGGGGNSNIINSIAGEGWIAFQQTDHRFDYEIIGTSLPKHTFFACSTKWGADPIYEYNFSFLGHGASSNR